MSIMDDHLLMKGGDAFGYDLLTRGALRTVLNIAVSLLQVCPGGGLACLTCQ